MNKPFHVNLVGGTKGLGRVFLKICEAQGWQASVVARHTCNEQDFACDVTKLDDIARCIEKVHAAYGAIQSIVFFQRFRGEGDSWEGHFEVSVRAIENYLKCALPYLDSDPDKDKSIVVVSSVSSLFVTPEQDAAYHASRAAQIGMVRYYAHKLGKQGVRVNAVSFGNIIKDTNVEYFAQNPIKREAMELCSPLHRMGTSQEIANVIKFLVSSDASWITGQNFLVDGGSSLGWTESMVRNQ